MKIHLWMPVALVALGASSLVATQTFAAAGSGNSMDNRNNYFVVICHYDRNQQGPNAGPHSIAIDVRALDHHLLNHVKDEGFIGDDFIGECPTVPTVIPATNTPVPTPTDTPAPTDTPEPIPTDTPAPTDTPEPTLEPATVTPEPTVIED